MSDMTQAPINGNYGAQHGFPDAFNPAHAAMNTAANFQPAQSSTPTILHYLEPNPDKLHLFYSKRSQLVFGTEAESVPVAVGTKAINEKIKSLDFSGLQGGPVTDEAAATKVEEKLETEITREQEQPEEVAPQTNGAAAEEPADAPAPVAEPEIQQEEESQTPEPTPVVEKEETPAVKEAAATPAPAPAAAPAAAAAPAPAAPVPAVPKTWASIASKATAAPSADATTSTPRAVATPAPVTEKDTASADAGWQTAGADHKKTQSRAGEDQVVLGYMKNVTEKVDAGLLKQTLARFGKLKYFDVNRPKNSAFVEFAEPSAYAAAVAANPHQIGTEQIVLEERRPRPNTFGNGYPAGRGRGGRGDRGGSQGRGGFQRDGRGGFAPRGGRGGNAAAKARNGAPAA
ncbi:hypothetical protein POX_a00841 [Penicillium oxalicum]|uniref:hypothetical protein n=1 Tax=Penicillium oxalicum TaxID=69781 RepID=UPI0020B75335|nr:hypothetical protein POX_a00841 [Penicillium oxalicum]KAI2794249.1 hypothetical protein POX_a00841 [Penicillium oxalicum]